MVASTTVKMAMSGFISRLQQQTAPAPAPAPVAAPVAAPAPAPPAHGYTKVPLMGPPANFQRKTRNIPNAVAGPSNLTGGNNGMVQGGVTNARDFASSSSTQQDAPMQVNAQIPQYNYAQMPTATSGPIFPAANTYPPAVAVEEDIDMGGTVGTSRQNATQPPAHAFTTPAPLFPSAPLAPVAQILPQKTSPSQGTSFQGQTQNPIPTPSLFALASAPSLAPAAQIVPPKSAPAPLFPQASIAPPQPSPWQGAASSNHHPTNHSAPLAPAFPPASWLAQSQAVPPQAMPSQGTPTQGMPFQSVPFQGTPFQSTTMQNAQPPSAPSFPAIAQWLSASSQYQQPNIYFQQEPPPMPTTWKCGSMEISLTVPRPAVPSPMWGSVVVQVPAVQSIAGVPVYVEGVTRGVRVALMASDFAPKRPIITVTPEQEKAHAAEYKKAFGPMSESSRKFYQSLADAPPQGNMRRERALKICIGPSPGAFYTPPPRDEVPENGDMWDMYRHPEVYEEQARLIRERKRKVSGPCMCLHICTNLQSLHTGRRGMGETVARAPLTGR